MWDFVDMLTGMGDTVHFLAKGMLTLKNIMIDDAKKGEGSVSSEGKKK